MVYEECSELIQALAIFGGIFIYAIIGIFIGWLINEIFKDSLDDDCLTLALLFGIFWPIAIPLGIIICIFIWILMPVWVASRRDLRNTERRLSNEISDYCAPVNLRDYSSNNKVKLYYDNNFKVGDIVTGKVIQTDSKGNKVSYNHLYNGCKCRVLEINDMGIMKLVLIDHRDKLAHNSVIGDFFEAPERNFVKIKSSKKTKSRR